MYISKLQWWLIQYVDIIARSLDAKEKKKHAKSTSSSRGGNFRVNWLNPRLGYHCMNSLSMRIMRSVIRTLTINFKQI
jgi:hypothetical protein